jgi:hypothetical protein
MIQALSAHKILKSQRIQYYSTTVVNFAHQNPPPGNNNISIFEKGPC